MRFRRHFILLIGCLFGAASLAAPARAADSCAPPDRPMGWIVSVQGEVEVQEDPGAALHPARPEETLCSRAILQVGDRSRARIALANAPLSLDQNTTLHLVGGLEPVRAEDEPLLIRLVRGALYVFSREPRALTINTPFVAAGIEGTEFLVRVEEDRTRVTVFEGVVAARNAHGQMQVTSGQSVVAEAGKAPVPVVVARPRDAVQWALHYPSVLPPSAPSDLSEAVREALLLAGRGDLPLAFARLERVPEAERGASFHLHRAALLLSVGRVDEARADIDQALLKDPAGGLAYALRTVIAVAQNDRTQALTDARQGVELSPREAAPKIALSYAEQAHFELEAARDALLQAVEDEPKNALAWARLAELWLMLGYRARAREAAETAGGLAPQLERVQTVLGFAALSEFRTRAAKAAFERAIALNSADPLPRFGLGLAKIRQSNLEEGRRDIEIAVGLDPASALLRSYLGKAYFEERTTDPVAYFRQLFENFPNQENTLAGEQFAIAKDLDPLDPTAYFYDAIRKQSENRPVEALRDAETAIRLNENRAVFRSRELLDQDRAARGASLGRIYNDLAFEQLGINEATKSLTLDPASASAHRFLSDIYATQPRREIARVSELLQAQLLQDININPIQPSLSETNLNIFARGGPARPGFNEFTPLFERNQAQFNLSGEVGSNDTFANEAVVSGLYDRFSLSAGQFHYQTDGFRENFDLEQDIYNLFAQAALTPKFNVQAEFLSRRSEEGDLRLNFNPDVFSEDRRRDVDQDMGRLGLRLSFAPNSDLIGSLILNNRDQKTRQFPTDVRGHQEGFQVEVQHLFRHDFANFTSGVSLSEIDASRDILFFPIFRPGVGFIRNAPIHEDFTIKQEGAYLYSTFNFPSSVDWTFGISYDEYDEAEIDIEKLSPKLGVEWDITDKLRFRLAAFRVVKPALITNRTIQPTQVAGFNQFFDDVNGTVSWRYGVGLDARLMRGLYGGAEFSSRRLDEPVRSVFSDRPATTSTNDIEEKLYKAYIYWTIAGRWVASGEFQFDSFTSSATPRQVNAIKMPLSIAYFGPLGFFGSIGATFVHQEVDRSALTQKEDDAFVIIDAAIGFRLPQRRGLVSLDVKNLLNHGFKYQDDSFRAFGSGEPMVSPFIPERMIIARILLNF